MGEAFDCEFINREGLLQALFSAPFGDPEFVPDEMGGDLERDDLGPGPSAVTDDEFHIDQMGNDLEVTFEGADGLEVQVQGTITGDEVHFIHSEEQELQTLELDVLQILKLDVHTEISGTVLGEDRMVLRQESDWALQVPDGEPVTGEVDCTFHATRN